jgi:type III pantothenate kinase
LDCGLENRTLEPERVGRDRLFAARGALECLSESAIVIDVGTALTVDALLALHPASSDADWRSGAFLGGAIAPGATLLARALASGAARLFEVTPRPDPPALGRDSNAAMSAGIGVGLRGAARELASEVAREAGLVDPPLALTGGGRAFVASAFHSRRVFESADLVHLGLCAALLQAGGCPRPAAFGAR